MCFHDRYMEFGQLRIFILARSQLKRVYSARVQLGAAQRLHSQLGSAHFTPSQLISARDTQVSSTLAQLAKLQLKCPKAAGSCPTSGGVSYVSRAAR